MTNATMAPQIPSIILLTMAICCAVAVAEKPVTSLQIGVQVRMLQHADLMVWYWCECFSMLSCLFLRCFTSVVVLTFMDAITRMLSCLCAAQAIRVQQLRPPGRHRPYPLHGPPDGWHRVRQQHSAGTAALLHVGVGAGHQGLGPGAHGCVNSGMRQAYKGAQAQGCAAYSKMSIGWCICKIALWLGDGHRRARFKLIAFVCHPRVQAVQQVAWGQLQPCVLCNRPGPRACCQSNISVRFRLYADL